MGGDCLRFLKWNMLENRVCGVKEINVDALLENVQFETKDELKSWFASILLDFSQNMLRKYLQFVWGRQRLPSSGKYTHYVKSVEYDNNDERLPVGRTCFFSLDLPVYSSIEIMREKLEYAINNCVLIDSDFNV